MKNKIDVVLVTFNPNIDMLIKCIRSLELQVRKIWVVDNYSTECDVQIDLIDVSNKIQLISLSENKGIAYAQNIGIKQSLAGGGDYILLSDQDTVYPEQFVKQMLATFEEKQFNNIAAVAPLFHDDVGGNTNDGFAQISRFGYSQVFPEAGVYEINHTIASGLIIKLSTINNIDLMDEELFIDWVDYEWCWRAIAKGYCILGNANILIEHHLGDRSTTVGSKCVNLRSPVRHYYITRNAFYLAWRSPYLDIWHRIALIYKGILYIVGYSTLSKPRLTNLKKTLLGLYHSIIGRLGRL